MAARILLVDDDPKLRRILTLRLETEGYTVAAAESGQHALERLNEVRPQFVLADLRMPDMDGIELMRQLHQRSPGLPVAILTAHGDIPEAVRATHAGAVDFLTKPIEREQLIDCIRRHLQADAGLPTGEWAAEIVTRSPLMQQVLEDARRVARTDSAVLIAGASGTGKEMLARAIHRASRRVDRPFIAINCAAVPADLLESELFGHKRGSFTGAHTDHPGLFRAADGGTVFLDEIGDMPTELQVKLLRVLQERELRPVGETRTLPVDVRVLSATHRDLDAHVKSGAFREDLFYRLKVVELKLPTLDQRREDIPLLVAHRLGQLVADGAPRRVYSPEAMELLVAASWPGHVRQLFNVVEQNVALSPGRVISGALVRKALGEQGGGLPSFDEARAEFTRNYLRQLLELSNGNISRAARLAERNRTDFYKILSRYGIDPSEYKGRSRKPAAPAPSQGGDVHAPPA
ncbi:MAG TPA: sigma 54-interacting transcriptional regulator [Candidatus Binatia bacterium]|nr:sigma 54-interacting transcriptional regulator [Candidatus Binatia bacterium]